jgi:hypothetical protein
MTSFPGGMAAVLGGHVLVMSQNAQRDLHPETGKNTLNPRLVPESGSIFDISLPFPLCHGWLVQPCLLFPNPKTY